MADFYDYKEEMKQDILDAIKTRYDKDDLISFVDDNDKDGLIEMLTDDFFVNDNVTGNGSGSYFANAKKAQNAVSGNTDLLADAIEEFDITAADLAKHIMDYEWQDVLIRCNILSGVIEDVVENDWDEVKEIIEKLD